MALSSEQEMWNQVVSRSFDYSSPPEDAWYRLNKCFKNEWGEPILPPPFSTNSARPDIVDSFPFISYPTTSPHDIWYPPKPSNKSYSWKFPPQDTQLSDNSSTKPDVQDITSLATDENVYIDAAGMTNITCVGGSIKPAADVGSNKPAADVGSIKPAADVGSIKPPGDVGSIKDSCCACYLCGKAEHFARKCSLGCDCGNSTT